MLRIMSDFKNSKIYKLTNSINNKLYVGSTTTDLKQRKYKHISHTKNNLNSFLYRNLRKDKVNSNNIDLILIEKFPCQTRFELHKRERYWIEKLKSEYNKNLPSRNKHDYYISNKKKCNAKSHENYLKNQEKYKTLAKKYRQKNKESISKKQKLKTKCICGMYWTGRHKNRHLKTKNHHTLLISLLKDKAV